MPTVPPSLPPSQARSILPHRPSSLDPKDILDGHQEQLVSRVPGRRRVAKESPHIHQLHDALDSLGFSFRRLEAHSRITGPASSPRGTQPFRGSAPPAPPDRGSFSSSTMSALVPGRPRCWEPPPTAPAAAYSRSEASDHQPHSPPGSLHPSAPLR